LERGRATVTLPRVNRIYRPGGPASPRAARLSCGWLVSRSIPRHLASYRFNASALPFRRLRGLRCRSDEPVTRVVRLPQAFAPLQSSSRKSSRRDRSPFAALSRGFSPLQRDPTAGSHHFPGLPRPGPVAPSRFPSASTPCSTCGLPGVFQPGTLMGFHPSTLDLTRIVLASRRDSPLMRLARPGSASPDS
jgi:hypothetical protein